jgi:Fe-S cluster assembly protein SufD
MSQVADTHDTYVADFERAASLRQDDPGWLARARKTALDSFLGAGFPTTRDEEWRFTNVAPIAETAFARAPDVQLSADQLRPFLFEDRALLLVLVNGRFNPGLSDLAAAPRGLRIGSLAQWLREDPAAAERVLTRHAAFDRSAFVALNTAFFTDGALVHVPDRLVVEHPVHVLYISTGDRAPVASHPRTLVMVGESAQLTIVEDYVCVGGGYFTNAVTESVVGRNGRLDHYKVQRESHDAYHVATNVVHGSRDATFSSISVSFGGKLVRNDAIAVLAGEGIDGTLNGLYLANGSRLVDNHTTIDHAMPHCASHEVYKGILGESARAVFNGKIVVRQDAQKTDAKQTNRALLLSDEAQINTKPQLEIFADDVRCTHGAAIGQLDDEAVFYLRARGLGLDEARNLLIHAFAGEVLQDIKVPSRREQLDAELVAHLPTGVLLR